MNKPKKVALAYSGGLDTSVIIPWLKENYGCEVVAVCGDIGQGGDELTGLEAKARKSGDRNIWHISHEGGALEDPANAAPDEIWMLTKSPAEAPNTPGEVAIGFEKGVPVSVNGKTMKAFELLETLNSIGSEHGIGRID